MLSLDRRRLMAMALLMVCGAALLRAGALINKRVVDDRGPSPEVIAAIWDAVRSDPSDFLSRAIDSGIQRVDRLRFDESAAVILTYGDDGKPGQAEIDDNLDKIVDNVSEVGAVGSDDQCLAPWDPTYQAAQQQKSTVTISRGTFEMDNREIDSAGGIRYLLHGRSADADWSWMIVP